MGLHFSIAPRYYCFVVQVSQYEDERSTLLATAALLTGAFYPLLARSVALTAQRQILTEQLSHFETFKKTVLELVNTLNMDSSAANVRF